MNWHKGKHVIGFVVLLGLSACASKPYSTIQELAQAAQLDNSCAEGSPVCTGVSPFSPSNLAKELRVTFDQVGDEWKYSTPELQIKVTLSPLGSEVELTDNQAVKVAQAKWEAEQEAEQAETLRKAQVFIHNNICSKASCEEQEREWGKVFLVNGHVEMWIDLDTWGSKRLHGRTTEVDFPKYKKLIFAALDKYGGGYGGDSLQECVDIAISNHQKQQEGKPISLKGSLGLTCEKYVVDGVPVIHMAMNRAT